MTARCCEHAERWHNDDGVCLFGWPESPCVCPGLLPTEYREPEENA